MILSIIITAHSEGALLLKTIQSIDNAINYASLKSYEIIIHLDNADSITEKISSRLQERKDCTVYSNNFGDLGSSRNFCRSRANGEYVFFVDADDLVSENLFKNCIETAKDNQNAIIHPEVCISFENAGKFYSYWKMNNSRDRNQTIFFLFERNLWISSVFGKKSIFDEIPYSLSRDGFGHEDYDFNIRVLDHNYDHVIAKDTVHFYRQKKTSLLRTSNAKMVTQRKTNIFSPELWKNFNFQMPTKNKKSIKASLRTLYIRARNRKIINTIVSPIATIAKNITGKKLIKPTSFDKIILNQWKLASKIEPQLYPTKEKLRDLAYYTPENSNKASLTYQEIAKALPEEADYIFVVPWIITGGADKVLINYTNALHELHPDWKIAIITTIPSRNEWRNRLPENTFHINFGNYSSKYRLEEYEKEILFTRLVVQLDCPKLHIINSEYAYKWVDSHKDYVDKNIDLRVSLFCHDIIPGTKGEGIIDYADPYAISIMTEIKHIFSDNTTIAEKLYDLGFEKSLIKTHFQPCLDKAKRFKVHKNTKGIRIFWASRICAQKNPEILLRLDSILPDNVNIDIYGKFDENYNADFFANLKHIKYISSFQGLDTIPIEDYDCMLYTSLIDGLPNILIEASVRGVPIISTNAGGITDLIKNKKSGIIVDDPHDVNKFSNAIIYALENKDKLQEYSSAAQKIAIDRHSWNNFKKEVANDF